ncbi:hypothetical protein L211DRAFT_846004 [Terfezia boudieri ATCC MYA-4762]|uniref:Ribosomal protein/NADH dehydrogenase domain-containing protein n=1 Tax=Terfezia boudieri ATCC MYA-4762 TaxID=1051890 RepID=A0A3N4M5D3_9PEZI|nr:hypothetical protein L211DRAFT_846004 [Terfezia boudieri ATCC MYA-4762]
MVSIIQRMKVLQGKLATLRHGPGAAILPPNVQKLSLNFPYRNKGGHMGTRKFWQLYLPRIKYYNPTFPIEVIRREGSDAAGPATITIHFTDKPPHIIDSKNRLHSELCAQFLDITQATAVPPNPEDAKAAAEYAEYVKAEEASARAKEAKRQAKREEKERERLGGVAM